MQKESILQSSLVMFGETGAGKTSILLKLMKEDTNILKVSSTLAIQFESLKGYHREKRFSISINDLPGQKSYRFAVPSYFRRKQIYVYVFDSERWYNGKKYEIIKQIEQWFKIAREATSLKDQEIVENCIVLFVANKIDLINTNQLDSFQEDVSNYLKAKLQLYKARMFFTSALEGINIKELLNYALDQVYSRRQRNINPNSFLPDFTTDNRQSKGRISLDQRASKFKKKKKNQKQSCSDCIKS